MTIRTIPGHGPTAMGISTQPTVKIPYGATPIEPEDSFCEEHGEVQIVAEFGSLDILSCGCEFNTK